MSLSSQEVCTTTPRGCDSFSICRITVYVMLYKAPFGITERGFMLNSAMFFYICFLYMTFQRFKSYKILIMLRFI